MFKSFSAQIKRIKGNDIFVSYSRADSLDYALFMANQLSSKQYFCYLDQFHNHPGEKIPEELINALKSCSAMVIILSPKAFQSKAMFQEVIEFKKTGRLIIPIKIEHIKELGVYEEALKGLAITTEKTDAWQNSKPSKKIIDRIIGSFIYRKRLKVLKTVGTIITTLIIAGISFGMIYSYLLKKDIDNLQTDKKILANQKNDLEIQKSDLADSISIQKDSINIQKDLIDTQMDSISERNYKITELDLSISDLNNDLDQSKLLLKRLNDSANTLYASNLIGLLKNEELANNDVFSYSFNPFNINRRMLLAIESYKINKNKDAEQILNQGVSFLGAQKVKRIFNDKVRDVTMSFSSFYENYFAVLLENGDIYVSLKNKTLQLKKLLNIPHASRLYFLNSDELLIVSNIPNQSQITVYNHKKQTKDSFLLPIRCKKLDFDDKNLYLYVLDYSGNFLCYDLKQKKVVFTEKELNDFAINKTRAELTSSFPRITDEIALWKGDTIQKFNLDKTIGKEKDKIYLPYDLFSNMKYSSGGNFLVNGTDMEGLSLGKGINKMYFDRPFSFMFSNKKQQTFAYSLGIANIGFGILDSEIYFSSMKGGENAVHFMQMYTINSEVKEVFRILYPTEIIKLYFDSFDRILFGIDMNGHLLGWDVSNIWQNELNTTKLEGEALINAVCERLLSNFTEEEWNHFFKDKEYCKTCPQL